MAENKFLESSKARAEQLREKHDHVRQSADERAEFWSVLKSYLVGWNGRLDQLDQQYGGSSIRDKNLPLAENEKQKLQLELSRLKDELIDVRRRCLSSGTAFTDEGSHDDTRPRLPSQPPDSLPFGDLRLLYDELQRRQETLEKLQTKLLPKGKFVFKRYHKAVEALRARGKDLSQLESIKLVSETSQNSQSVPSGLSIPGSLICGFDHVSIEVDGNGAVSIRSLGTLEALPEKLRLDQNESVVIRDMSHCTINLQGSYPSIHAINVTDSAINILQQVSGAAHVTACHRTRLDLRSQQLRLHESTDLSCYTSAATILEDCRRICFFSNDVKADSDIKDFSFLREGIQSPNFTVENLPGGERSSHELAKRGVPTVRTKSSGHARVSPEPTDIAPTCAEFLGVRSQDSDDDEDEL